jgi:hypothetical protein
MTSHRLPLPANVNAWCYEAFDCYRERLAILEADRIPDAQKKAQDIVRRWWAMGGDMPPEW